MHGNRLDRTEAIVSALAFGTASLHHIAFQKGRQRLLHEALSQGITHFDTSPYYGFGLAETEIGAVVARSRSQITITTKVGLYSALGSCSTGAGVWIRKLVGKVNSRWASSINWSVKAAQDSLHGSLRRLKTEYVDFLFLHEPHPAAMRSEEFLAWLQREQRAGKVRYFGLAGQLSGMLSWVESAHPLADVIQTKDSLDHREADALLALGRPLQFTYGYLSSGLANLGFDSPLGLLGQALERNRGGCVVFSTRDCERMRAIASLAS
jgi:aryl-alcohol dehydrogenase-like predicted oxidoreductase